LNKKRESISLRAPLKSEGVVSSDCGSENRDKKLRKVVDEKRRPAKVTLPQVNGVRESERFYDELHKALQNSNLKLLDGRNG
jgi:hypothetical protein